jgi:hypothetical protein
MSDLKIIESAKSNPKTPQEEKIMKNYTKKDMEHVNLCDQYSVVHTPVIYSQTNVQSHTLPKHVG